MKAFKILVYNTKTGYVWTFSKQFSGSEQVKQYCMKRSDGMYIVTYID